MATGVERTSYFDKVCHHRQEAFEKPAELRKDDNICVMIRRALQVLVCQAKAQFCAHLCIPFCNRKLHFIMTWIRKKNRYGSSLVSRCALVVDKKEGFSNHFLLICWLANGEARRKERFMRPHQGEKWYLPEKKEKKSYFLTTEYGIKEHRRGAVLTEVFEVCSLWWFWMKACLRSSCPTHSWLQYLAVRRTFLRVTHNVEWQQKISFQWDSASFDPNWVA